LQETAFSEIEALKISSKGGGREVGKGVYFPGFEPKFKQYTQK
jgi:hypothetical protein